LIDPAIAIDVRDHVHTPHDVRALPHDCDDGDRVHNLHGAHAHDGRDRSYHAHGARMLRGLPCVRSLGSARGNNHHPSFAIHGPSDQPLSLKRSKASFHW